MMIDPVADECLWNHERLTVAFRRERSKLDASHLVSVIGDRRVTGQAPCRTWFTEAYRSLSYL